MTDLSGYLSMRFPDGVQVNDEWRTQCPNCMNEKERFFIDAINGKSYCHHCGARSGSWVGLIAMVEGLYGKGQIGQWIRAHETDLKSTYRNPHNKTSRIPMVLSLPPECIPIEPGDPFCDYLNKRGITWRTVKQYHMHKCVSGKYKFRIIIPVFENDRLVYFFDRTVDPTEKAKTLGIGTQDTYWPIEKSRVVFNLDAVRGRTDILIAEGILSALSLGENKTIALLGKTCSQHQLKKILDTGVTSITLCLDPDAIKQTADLASRLAAWGIRVSVCNFEYGYDPNDYLVHRLPIPNPEPWNLMSQIRLHLNQHNSRGDFHTAC